MKKFSLSFVTFSIVWACVAVICYLLSRLFNQDWFTGWAYYVVIIIACTSASIFGPSLAARVEKLFKKKS